MTSRPSTPVAFFNTINRLWFDADDNDFTSPVPIAVLDIAKIDTITDFLMAHPSLVHAYAEGDTDVARILLNKEPEIVDQQVADAIKKATLYRELTWGTDLKIDQKLMNKLEELSRQHTFKDFRFIANKDDICDSDRDQISATRGYWRVETPNYHAIPPNVAMQMRLRGVLVVDLDLFRKYADPVEHFVVESK